MKTLSADQIVAELAPFLAEAGIVQVSVEVRPYDEPPFDTHPVADVTFSLDGTSPEDAVRRMKALERAIGKAHGCSVRTGYYGREEGYDDIPDGHAMIEIDQLPFTLDRTSAPAPR